MGVERIWPWSAHKVGTELSPAHSYVWYPTETRNLTAHTSRLLIILPFFFYFHGASEAELSNQKESLEKLRQIKMSLEGPVAASTDDRKSVLVNNLLLDHSLQQWN